MLSDEIRDVVVRLAVEQTKSKIEVDTTQAVEGLSDVNAGVVQASDEVEILKTEFGGLGESTDDLADKMKEFAQQASDALEETTDQAFKAGEGFKAAGAGALTLARGAALLGFSAEDDLRKFAKQLATIQGLYDALQGSFDTVKGLTEGIRGLTGATTALSTAQTAAAGSSQALATGINSVKTAILPLTIGAGVLAGLGVAYLLLKDDAVDPLNESLKENLRLQKVLLGLQQRGDTLAASRRQLLESDLAIADLETRIRAIKSEIDQQRFAEDVLPTPFGAGAAQDPRLIQEQRQQQVEGRLKREIELEEREFRERARLISLINEERAIRSRQISDLGDDNTDLVAALKAINEGRKQVLLDFVKDQEETNRDITELQKRQSDSVLKNPIP